LAAAIVRRGTAAITVILDTGTIATTRATTAMAGEATIGLGGAIGTTAGIMAGGTDTGGAADTAGMAADGTAIIDSESRPRCPASFAIAYTWRVVAGKSRFENAPVAGKRAFIRWCALCGFETEFGCRGSGGEHPLSNGPVEGHIDRLKMVKRQMYGRAGVELLVFDPNPH
jgi:hypothetical protein